MANFLSNFVNNRFIQPAVTAGVEIALSTNHPPAYGASVTQEISLAKSIGQPHDADYALLYALYKLNTDVSGCVHKWAGGVVGAGWRITTMDPKAKLTPALVKEMQESERWLKNPNPTKLFETMLYELVQHFGIVGDSYWYVSEDKNGKPIEIWPMHPALTKVVATEKSEILGYVMRSPGGDPVTFEADEVLHFPLSNPTHDLYGELPLELVIEEAGIDLQALRSNKAIFQNGLNPSAVLLMNEDAKREDAQAMTDQFNQSHAAATNQHKVVSLSCTTDLKLGRMTKRSWIFVL